MYLYIFGKKSLRYRIFMDVVFFHRSISSKVLYVKNARVCLINAADKRWELQWQHWHQHVTRSESTFLSLASQLERIHITLPIQIIMRCNGGCAQANLKQLDRTRSGSDVLHFDRINGIFNRLALSSIKRWY